MATLPGMGERRWPSTRCSKTYSVTGWRVGWVIAPAELTVAIRKVHDFLTVGAAAPLQAAGVVALALPDAYYDDAGRGLPRRRDLLLRALEAAGFRPYVPDGAYYVMTDIGGVTGEDDVAFARRLVGRSGRRRRARARRSTRDRSWGGPRCASRSRSAMRPWPRRLNRLAAAPAEDGACRAHRGVRAGAGRGGAADDALGSRRSGPGRPCCWCMESASMPVATTTSGVENGGRRHRSPRIRPSGVRRIEQPRAYVDRWSRYATISRHRLGDVRADEAPTASPPCFSRPLDGADSTCSAMSSPRSLGRSPTLWCSAAAGLDSTIAAWKQVAARSWDASPRSSGVRNGFRRWKPVARSGGGDQRLAVDPLAIRSSTARLGRRGLRRAGSRPQAERERCTAAHANLCACTAAMIRSCRSAPRSRWPTTRPNVSRRVYTGLRHETHNEPAKERRWLTTRSPGSGRGRAAR